MTKEETKAAIELMRKETEEEIKIMQAYVDGNEIEVQRPFSQWEDTVSPSWLFDEYNYRIKPQPKQPKYRPYTFDEAVEHLLGKKVRYNNHAEVTVVTIINADNVDGWFNYYTFLDGTPCGMKVEE